MAIAGQIYRNTASQLADAKMRTTVQHVYVPGCILYVLSVCACCLCGAQGLGFSSVSDNILQSSTAQTVFCGIPIDNNCININKTVHPRNAHLSATTVIPSEGATTRKALVIEAALSSIPATADAIAQLEGIILLIVPTP